MIGQRMNWRDSLKDIAELRDEYNNNFSMMTDYERSANGKILNEYRERNRSYIEIGALQEWQAAKNELENSLKNLQDEKRKVVNSYDPVKLAAEMQLATMRIDQASKSDAGLFNQEAINDLISEANLSNDKHKQKATYEALQGLVSKVKHGETDSHGVDMRRVANKIAFEARNELAALNESDGLEKANAAVKDKLARYNGAKSTLYEVADTMGDVTGDIIHNTRIEKAIHAVRVTPDGNIAFMD